jgi:hypothetical protein
VEAALCLGGYAVLPALLSPAECAEAAGLWQDEGRFRKRIDMASHRYGQGDYRYFAYPLPTPIAVLREALYAPLAVIANGWQEALRRETRFPATLQAFLAHCHALGQERPTPLLLRYETGGWNAMHQDVYGDVSFPLQVAILLSRPGEDFEGGEFLLLSQRPRAQSRGEAVALRQGDAIVFPNADRPGPGVRLPIRWSIRHGVSTIHAGVRMTLGLIFHDAK